MTQQDNTPTEERDLDEAAHQQLKEEQNKPLTPATGEEVLEEEHDLDEAAHQQLEEGADN